MKLAKLRIQNFKCIEDSDEFSLNNTTCLVGKNESGKTAILEALYKLNPAVANDGSFIRREFPRRFWDEFSEKQPAVTSSWLLDEEDVRAVEGVLGPACLSSREVAVTKGFDNKVRWTVSVDENAIVKYFVGSVELSPGAAERLSGISTLSDLLAVVTAEETKGEQELHAVLNDRIPKGDARRSAITVLESRLPVFLYFPDYAVMPGRVAIKELLQRAEDETLSLPDEIFVALLALADNSPEGIAEITQTEDLIAELEGVSNSISDEIFEYWSQNRHLEVDFRYQMGREDDPPPFNEGWVFETRIKNARHRATVNFDDRSSGFTWFFSFLVWFSHLKSVYGDRLFLLLDEPGLNLHARAQADLLRFFRERLGPAHQLVYTTHSPFMIDPENLLGARTVEDVVQTANGREVLLGTRVGDRVLSTERDTLFPLYAALGYDITQTLFVGKNTVLVEGPSDLLYLKWASHQLGELGRTELDSRWTISPTGGIDKVSSFVTLFGGLDLNVAVFTDFHSGAKAKVRSLRESQILRAGKVLSAEAYVEGDEADIEDILGRANYVGLVNEAFGWLGDRAIPLDRPETAPVRVAKEVEDHNKTLRMEAAEFDHYTPAVYLTEHAANLELPELGAALDRFERLFSDLNALLKD